MVKKKTKLKQMLELSDEILDNLENRNILLEKTILKCKKLARMRDDFDAIKWFTLELHGFAESDMPSDIKREDLDKAAIYSGRTTIVTNSITKKKECKYWTASISGLEAEIQTNLIALENLKPPAQFNPAVRKYAGTSYYTGEYSGQAVVEKYQDVLNALARQKVVLSAVIKNNRILLSKIRNNVYNYVLKINLQLRFENITESIFQKTKKIVDQVLSKICPEAVKKFVTAYERLKSNNPEEWSQALSSCRNILQDFADYVFPARNTLFTLKNGDKLQVTEDKYKNRLLAFIDRECQGNRKKLLQSRMADLISRIHNLNDILSRGTHKGKSLEFVDVNICVIDTYLLIGSLLSVTNALKK